MKHTNQVYDAFIIGGGIHGAAVARNLASKGYSVALCDEKDISGNTCTHISKLFQCGFDHLENLDLEHVSNSLRERVTLCEEVPHLIRPIEITILDNPSVRSPLKMKLGAILYNWLRSSIQAPRTTLSTAAYKTHNNSLLSISDKGTLCQEYLIDDSRLIIENLLHAQQNDCQMFPRTAVVAGFRHNGHWLLTLEDSVEGEQIAVRAQCIINASGAWAHTVLEQTLGCASRCMPALEKHSYITLPKFFEGDQGYLLQLPTREFLPIIPGYGTNCIVGPIVTPSPVPTHDSTITSEEENTLLIHINEQFCTEFTHSDVIESYTTITPSITDTHQPVHLLDLQCSDGQSPVLSIFSGHLTTHRILAEQVHECIQPYLPSPNITPGIEGLPGGVTPNTDSNEFITRLKAQVPWLRTNLLTRYYKTYGIRAADLLKGIENETDLGKEVIPNLFERELSWLIESEWVTCANDVLWRRTRLGISVTNAHFTALSDWFTQHYIHQSAISKLNNLVHSERKAS